MTELHDFHKRVTAKDSRGRQPRRRLHFHFFESLKKPETPATLPVNAVPTPPTSSASSATGVNSDEPAADLSFGEAMSILEGRPWHPKEVNFWQRVHALKMWLLGPNSLYAAKTAGAATVFAIFIYVDTTRSWFISYNLTGGLITVVVALAPTLGKSAPLNCQPRLRAALWPHAPNCLFSSFSCACISRRAKHKKHASRLVSDMCFFLIRSKRPYILIPNCGERNWVSRRLGFPIGKLIASARLLIPVCSAAASWSIAPIQIFHNVGGYIYNPYGITCLVFLYCLPLQYLIVSYPTGCLRGC